MRVSEILTVMVTPAGRHAVIIGPPTSTGSSEGTASNAGRGEELLMIVFRLI